MNQVFVDTVGFLALWDKKDQWHLLAEEAFQRVYSEKLRLVSTSFVFLEVGNAAARKPYRSVASQFHAAMERDGSLIVPTPEDIRAAWDAYARSDSGDTGIVDQVTFQVLRRLGMTQVLTHDRHFTAAGFETLF